MSKTEELREQFKSLVAGVKPPAAPTVVSPMMRKRLDGEDSFGGYPPAISAE